MQQRAQWLPDNLNHSTFFASLPLPSPPLSSPGGHLYIQGRGVNNQYVVNFIMLAAIHADTLASRNLRLPCGNTSYTPNQVLYEVKRQVSEGGGERGEGV